MEENTIGFPQLNLLYLYEEIEDKRPSRTRIITISVEIFTVLKRAVLETHHSLSSLLSQNFSLTEQGSGNRSHIKLYYSRTVQRNSLSLLLQEQGSSISLFTGISLLFSLLSQVYMAM